MKKDSELVTVELWSPNYNAGNYKKDGITIHCFVGQVTAKRGLEVFMPSSRQASCNYVVGYDGQIGQGVLEKNRSWCSSNRANDERCVTIEVASDNFYPYAITNEAYASLIKLCADICKRNGIKALKFSTDKNERVNRLNGVNMTVHRDYANKSCPGDYIYQRLGQIANEVNVLLNEKPIPTPQPKPEIDMLELVRKTIRGDFGNGITRKQNLGSNYAEVQRQVNLNIQNGLTRWDNIKLF